MTSLLTTTLDAGPGRRQGQVLAHPLAVLVERISAAVDGAVGGPAVWSMGGHEQRHTWGRWAKVQAELDAQRLLVLVQADRDGAAVEAGASSAAAGWR